MADPSYLISEDGTLLLDEEITPPKLPLSFDLKQRASDVASYEVSDDGTLIPAGAVPQGAMGFSDGMPVLLDTPALGIGERAYTKFITNDPMEEAKLLSSKGYKTRYDPQFGALVYDEGKKAFSPTDLPGGAGGLKELFQDVVTDIAPSFLGVAAKTPGIGAVLGAGTQGIREIIRSQEIPETEIDPITIGLGAAFGAGTGALSKAKTVAGEQVSKATESLSKRIKSVDAEGVFSKGKQFIKSYLNNPERIIKEFGGSAKDLAPSNEKIRGSVNWLVNNSPFFKENILESGASVVNKAKGMGEYLSSLSDDLFSFYDDFQGGIKVSDVLNSESLSRLRTLVTDPQTLGSNARVARGVLSDVESTITKLAYSKLPKLEREVIAKRMVDDPEAAKELLDRLIQDVQIPLKQAWGMRKTLDDKVVYDALGTNRFNLRNQSYKDAADAFRVSIYNKVQSALSEEDFNAFVSLNDEVENLLNFYSLIDKEAGKRLVSKSLLESKLPGAIKSLPRRVFNIAERVARSEPGQAFLRKGAQIMTPSGIGAPPSPSSQITKAISGAVDPLTRIGTFGVGQELAKTYESAGFLPAMPTDIEPFPLGLPRDSERIDSNFIHDFLEKTDNNPVSQSLVTQLTEALRTGDPEKVSAVHEGMVKVYPQIFERGWGVNGKIRNKDLQIKYLEMLRSMQAKNRVDEAFLAKQESAFNDMASPDFQRILDIPPPSAPSPVYGIRQPAWEERNGIRHEPY